MGHLCPSFTVLRLRTSGLGQYKRLMRVNSHSLSRQTSSSSCVDPQAQAINLVKREHAMRKLTFLPIAAAAVLLLMSSHATLADGDRGSGESRGYGWSESHRSGDAGDHHSRGSRDHDSRGSRDHRSGGHSSPGGCGDNCGSVPEIDASSAAIALGLTVGLIALIRERRKST